MAWELDERFCAARAAWPGVDVPHDAFVAYVMERVAPPASLNTVHLADLYLACACARGDRAAIETFERSFEREIAAALARLTYPGVSGDDLRQSMREKLFATTASPDGSSGKIAEYRGQGKLKNWVRVAVLRLRIDAERRQQAKREDFHDDPDRVNALPDMSHDPELASMKSRYRAAFREAFAVAATRLTPRQRNLLRQRLAEDLSTSQLATLYNVHRATMKRWLASARGVLLEETRRELATRVGAEGAELDSVIRLIESNFDVTVGRLLRTGG